MLGMAWLRPIETNWLLLSVCGAQEVRTETLLGLDGVWEKVFEFDVTEECNDKLSGTFFMDEAQDGGL